jgi:hypothetical protein
MRISAQGYIYKTMGKIYFYVTGPDICDFVFYAQSVPIMLNCIKLRVNIRKIAISVRSVFASDVLRAGSVKAKNLKAFVSVITSKIKLVSCQKAICLPQSKSPTQIED